MNTLTIDTSSIDFLLEENQFEHIVVATGPCVGNMIAAWSDGGCGCR